MVKCNTYPKIYEYQNLIDSYRNARKNKSFRKAAIHFSMNVESELINIQNHLIYGTYKPGEYTSFKVFDPKERTILSLPFRDRVVQHALYGIIHPILEKGMINDSYACRIGKGTQRGVLREKEYQRKIGKGHYILKCDVRHFFASVDHKILKMILREKIRDHKILWLCYKFIPKEIDGIPPGNLTSEIYANLYLDQLDHHIRDELGIYEYSRYMDDFVLHFATKQEARRMKDHLDKWLWEKLRLKLNAKTQVFPEHQGVNYLGYMVHYDHIKIRHTTVRRIKHKIKVFRKKRMIHAAKVGDIRPALMSWKAMAKWGNCKTIDRKVMEILNET